MRIANLARLAALALPLMGVAACSTVGEAVRGPSLTPMGYPAALTPQTPQILTPVRDMPAPASANSLWRTGARAFFIDQRAARVGDILTVQIAIADNAQTANSSASSRQGKMTAGIPNLLGLETSLGRALPGAFDPANAINTNTATSNAGNGSITRSERINLTIAAVVTQVLPNGNLVIQGSQEVQTNAELRSLTVSGIVRPEDISSTNTIKHTQIAEARINYGGRGDITRVQKVPAGQALIERFSPF
jgi:flagellar L-ring protein precursor FlgH